MFKCYKLFDIATQAYVAITGCLIAIFQQRAAPIWVELLMVHIAVIGLIHGLIQWHHKKPNNLLITTLRHFYPLLLYTGFYRETAQLNQILYSGYLDPYFLQWEKDLFGFQPGLDLMQRFPYLWVSEILYASYFSYYLMLAGVGFVLFIKNRNQFFHYMFSLSFMLYICYLLYIVLPVVGPRITFIDIPGYVLPSEWRLSAGDVIYPPSIERGIFFQIMQYIYSSFEGPGAAFPSSHVAAAICTLYFSWKQLGRKWIAIHSVLVFFLCIATVYCHYHYVIDVLAGMMAAAIIIPLGNRIYFSLIKSRSIS